MKTRLRKSNQVLNATVFEVEGGDAYAGVKRQPDKP